MYIGHLGPNFWGKGRNRRWWLTACKSRASWYMLVGSLLLMNLLFTACSLGGDGETNGTPGSSQTAQPVALSQLPWCGGEPAQIFMDNRSAKVPDPVVGEPVQAVDLGPADGKPVLLDDWNTLKANLGFQVFLPETLPEGACLLSASGTVRDAVLGSNFTVTYMLPDGGALTIAQAPQHTAHKDLECSVSEASDTEPADAGTPSATPDAPLLPLQLCSGIRETTNVTFSARWDVPALQQFFEQLKANIEWKPAV